MGNGVDVAGEHDNPIVGDADRSAGGDTAAQFHSLVGLDMSPNRTSRATLMDQLEWYLAAFYPRMPSTAREAIIQKFGARPLTGRLPEVAGIMVSTHARHQFTDYETLLARGAVTPDGRSRVQIRSQARKAVAGELQEIIIRWQADAPVSHGALKSIQRRYRKRYQSARSESASEPTVALIVANENADLAEFCKKWIWGHFDNIEIPAENADAERVGEAT